MHEVLKSVTINNKCAKTLRSFILNEALSMFPPFSCACVPTCSCAYQGLVLESLSVDSVCQENSKLIHPICIIKNLLKLKVFLFLLYRRMVSNPLRISSVWQQLFPLQHSQATHSDGIWHHYLIISLLTADWLSFFLTLGNCLELSFVWRPEDKNAWNSKRFLVLDLLHLVE